MLSPSPYCKLPPISLQAFFDPTRLLTLRSPVVKQDEILAKAIHKIGRKNIQLAHKTGIQISVFPKLTLTPKGDPSFIRAECEGALQRLGTDYIDLFYLHRIDQTIPIEVSMLEMKKLVEEGKILYVGLSECSASTIRRAHAIHPITAVQLEYSLWCRDIEDDILPVCKELGIGLVAYSPLGEYNLSDGVVVVNVEIFCATAVIMYFYSRWLDLDIKTFCSAKVCIMLYDDHLLQAYM
jgi:diketogulonate reductase-like aldo/keto reductase